jgi:uracil phosphoribosyltransferase
MKGNKPSTEPYDLNIYANPLIEHDLTTLILKEIDLAEYNRAVGRVTFPLASMASLFLSTQKVDLTTKWGKTSGQVIDSHPLIVYIERGVKAMRYPFDLLYPDADTVTVNCARHHDDPWQAEITTANLKFPPHDAKRHYMIVDCTCATGGTIFAIAKRLRDDGLISKDSTDVDNLCVVSIFCGQPGLDRLFEEYPKLHIYTARVIPELDENCYLIHGPYDAGNRGNFRISTIESFPGGH